MKKATKYFREVFEKYDDLNASVQENISAVRVVKAYVREEYETTKFQKACNKVYEMFVRAEKLVVMNMPVMQFTVYACILGISWLGANMIVLYEYSYEPYDAFHGICYGHHERSKCRACN